MTVDVLELARELAQAGEPYVLATVVWRRAPSSGQAGSKAIVLADGRVRGWLAGACAEPAVVREARRALEDGAPRLVFLDPPGDVAEAREGVLTVPIACTSEGALGIYLEPVLPRPRLVAVGRSPVVDALAGMARALGWRAVVVDDGGSAADHPEADEVVTALDLEAAGAGERAFVVVATQGHHDERALEAALATGAPYVGLVASRRRAKSVFDELRRRGVSEEALGRVHAPAGLDLGHLATEEIAVAVLAEIVQAKAAGLLRPGTMAPPLAEVLDPVCGMTVEVASARHRVSHAGTEYVFCSAGCQARFESDPAHYAP